MLRSRNEICNDPNVVISTANLAVHHISNSQSENDFIYQIGLKQTNILYSWTWIVCESRVELITERMEVNWHKCYPHKI